MSKNIQKSKKGNSVVAAIIVSSLIIGGAASILNMNTSSFIRSSNIASSNIAYFEAEGNLEEALYVYAGHGLGFEISSDTDVNCDLSAGGTDSWCFESKAIGGIIEGSLDSNDFVVLGLYNDLAGAYDVQNLQNIIMDGVFELKIWTDDVKSLTNSVSEGDMRVTTIYESTEEYDAYSKVESSDLDMNNYLTDLSIIEPEYKITGNDRVWMSEYVYYDVNEDNIVSVGDVRITRYYDYPEGSDVEIDDTDELIGASLLIPENLGVVCDTVDCSSFDITKLYATTVGNIIISATAKDTDGVSDDVSENWIYSFSKNNFKGMDGSGVGKFIHIDNATQENMNIVNGRTLDEFFDPVDIDNSSRSWSAIDVVWPVAPNDYDEIVEPTIRINMQNSTLNYKITTSSDPADVQITNIETILTATTNTASTRKTLEIVLRSEEVIPIFGSYSVVY